MNTHEMDKAWGKLCDSAKRQANGKVGFDAGWTLAWHHFQKMIRKGKPALKRWKTINKAKTYEKTLRNL